MVDLAIVHLTSIHLRRFKAFSDFSVTLDTLTMLVGPNNSGKSTIISTLRVLAAAIQTARAKNPILLPELGDWVYGYRVPPEGIPVSMENVATDLSTDTAEVTFRFSNRNTLSVRFPPTGGCYLLSQTTRRPVANTGDFRREYPFQLVVVPVLGPVESDEALLEIQTVRRNLSTHRASRNFRNYWWHFSDGFAAFADLVAKTWPGITLSRPELGYSEEGSRLGFFCVEDRMTRELFWTGVGFQVWCQLLTHLVRAATSQLFVVDEPEIYLHPELQRQLLGLLRGIGPDILLATHSSDLIAEADPSELASVDKRLRAARRLRSTSDVSSVLQSIGSTQNVVLTQLARTRRLLFVEGQEYAILAAFARKIGLDRLASASDFAVFPYGGFPEPAAVAAIVRGVRGALGGSIAAFGVFDRDYRSHDEVHEVTLRLRESLRSVHILGRKEIENYLLVPPAIDRALRNAQRERARRTGVAPIQPGEPISDLLMTLTEPLRHEIQGQYFGKQVEFSRSRYGIDPATVGADVARWFDRAWGELETRLAVVPGKRVIQILNGYLQKKHQLALTWRMILSAMGEEEVAPEIRTLLKEMDDFRDASPDAASSRESATVADD